MDGISSLALAQMPQTGETSPLQVVRPSLDSGAIGQVGSAPHGSFADALGQAVHAIDAQQIEADQQSAQLALGGGNLHETAIALEKADVAMKLATKVRNKIVDAYQDVMKMSI